MDKRTITTLYWAVIAVEFLLCWKWLIQPYGPVFLSLLQGTFAFNSNFSSTISSLVKVCIQIIAFSFLFTGTTKLYRHFYVSLPSDNIDNINNK